MLNKYPCVIKNKAFVVIFLLKCVEFNYIFLYLYQVNE